MRVAGWWGDVNVNANTSISIRYYRAPTMVLDGQQGSWYGKCDGLFIVREFIVCSDGRTAVAPFDLGFREVGHPTKPPAIVGIEPISWCMFESL